MRLPCPSTSRLVFAGAFLSVFPLGATIQVTLAPSVPSPQPVGTKVTWTATAVDSNPGPVTYRFEYAPPQSSTFVLLRDFSLANTLDWVSIASEGVYRIRVTARDLPANETAQQTVAFALTSRVVGGQAVVSPTSHPLVALFSAPPCPAGSLIRASYQASGSAVTDYTSWSRCRATSMNFYVAGMRANTTYYINYQVATGGQVVSGPNPLQFQTGPIPADLGLPAAVVRVPAGPEAETRHRTLLVGFVTRGFVAYDLSGRIVWYYKTGKTGGQIARPLPGGTILMVVEGLGTGTGPNGPTGGVLRQPVLREFDLAGNLRRETNADRISEQLVSMGTDPIYDFNHDAIRLPNGYTVTMGRTQRIYPVGTQGSPDPINIVGQMIVVLDTNWQVVWYWNAFDHASGGTELDVNRAPLRGEMCTTGPGGETPPGCPPVLLSSPAPDWLHVNSLQYLADGNLLMSIRNQDWVIKIDYSNGAGTGDVLWRLGSGGDFAVDSTDPYPWFSAQHDAGFENGGLQLLSVFDNGNSRVSQFGGRSRGQVYAVDEANRTVTLALNADLGVYAASQGSAQALPNGNSVFHAGIIGGSYTQSIEVTPAGSIVFVLETPAISYRSFRMSNLYNPPGT